MREPDIAQVGALLLAGGKGLISNDWIQTSTYLGAGIESCYGLLWWSLRDGCIAGSAQSGASGPVEGFIADGWGGQYLIVIPQKQIVAVRLRALSDSESSDYQKQHSFPEFPTLVNKFSK